MTEAVAGTEVYTACRPARPANSAGPEALAERLRNENRELRKLLIDRQDSLLRARAQLGSLERMKHDFISLISHELRTPITTVVGLADLIRQGVLQSEAELRQHSGDIVEAALNLSRFVDDVLQFLEWTSGVLTLRVVSVDLEKSARAALEKVRDFLPDKGITLEWKVLEPRVVEGDAEALESCLARLIDNALKFSAPGGRVEIEIGPCAESAGQEPSVCVCVRDHGKGISAENMEHLYQLLTLCHSTRNHSRGRGLGLSIAREIAVAHGGSIRIESAGEGQGCEAVLTIPARQPRSGTGPGDARSNSPR